MFERNINLIGKEKFNLLQNKKILIIGLGGVGGYALETLARSGILNIDIIDFDKIDITNLNRQIITNQNNINAYKVEEAKVRALSINPNIKINTFKTFLDKNNIDDILSNNYDYVIDACDSIETKIELILKRDIYKYKLISSMGTAKKIDPTKLTITTLEKTSYDPLAKVIRKKLRELKYNKKVLVVSSTEQVIESDNLGSFMMVPASAGILLAKYVIQDILENK
ncbi:MAG: ThiF family adenylyltransferase [Bacilli bacterium]|nr:ThiF family adenylyltransferase [Bacilli bacterium]